MINGDMVTVGHGYKENRSVSYLLQLALYLMHLVIPVQVKILFEECFFNSHEESYQVFCLEQPLEGGESPMEGLCLLLGGGALLAGGRS